MRILIVLLLFSPIRAYACPTAASIHDNEYVWMGGAQLNDLRSHHCHFDTYIVPPKGAVISRVGIDTAIRLATDFQVPQIVLPNGDYQNTLLNWSRVETQPREVLHIRAFTSSGREIRAKRYVIGTSTNIPAGKSKSALLEFQKEQAPGGEALAIIEISHTHPFYEYSFQSSPPHSMGKTNLAPLSPRDLKSAEYFYKLLAPTTLMFTAIVPNGYHYSVIPPLPPPRTERQ